jgi:DNA-binding IclR family transcriptional regulator
MQKKRLDGWAGETPRYPIESVDNALRLLLLLGERAEVRLTEASQYLEVASSTAHRVLAMLQYRGFVRQDAATKAYRAGPALTSVAFAILGRLDIRERARPVLRRLNQEFDETVHLGVLDGGMVHFIDAVESQQAVRVSSRAGSSMPAYATSTGKALLAQLSREELTRLYPEQDLRPVTSHSLTSRSQLEKELAKARKQGFAVSQQESEHGVASVAVAVPNPIGTALAINCAVPDNRMNGVLQKRIVEALKKASLELGDLL